MLRTPGVFSTEENSAQGRIVGSFGRGAGFSVGSRAGAGTSGAKVCTGAFVGAETPGVGSKIPIVGDTTVFGKGVKVSGVVGSAEMVYDGMGVALPAGITLGSESGERTTVVLVLSAFGSSAVGVPVGTTVGTGNRS